MPPFEIDDAAQLGRLRAALGDDDAYAVLGDYLDELKALVERAKAEGCNVYGSRLVRKGLTIHIWFRGGKEVKAQISFKTAYEKRSGKPLRLATALELQSAVLTVVLNSDGMNPFRPR